jgi:RNA polymerase sigma factor (sigma-70 family)
MKPNEPPWDTPPLDLSPELKKAVQNALKQTNALCPPPRYDASYWREERIAIAQMAVWQAAQAYRDETGVPLEKFACLCAKRAIYAEWLALCQRDNAEEPFPVDEETGEELEFADVEAWEAIEMNALCAEVRAALAQLSEEERACVELYYGQGLSERELARHLGKSKSWVHRRLRAIEAKLRRLLWGDSEADSRSSKG